MNREDALFLVEYHNRANKKIFDAAAELSAEQLQRPNEFAGDAVVQVNGVLSIRLSHEPLVGREQQTGQAVQRLEFARELPSPRIA